MESSNNDSVTYTFEMFVTLEQLERKHLETALYRAGGNKTHAAKMLGISLKTLYNKLHYYEKLDSASVEPATSDRRVI